MNFNRIIIIGRLTRDPEPKSTPAGVPVTTFTVAVDRPQSAEARNAGQQKETDFFDVVTWRQLAENAANYLQKGKLVVVEGRLQIRNYVSQDGQQRRAVEIVADTFRNLEKRSDSEGYGDGDTGGGRDAYSPPAPARSAPVREESPSRGGYEPRGAAAPARGAAPTGRGGRNTPPPEPEDDFADPFDN
ncbi:MAG: single-stranded DNA-binding protein [Capsulimonadales bacterium]|nr:single-stranded DNA-binding protein [Capsulimonadales bacterium]